MNRRIVLFVIQLLSALFILFVQTGCWDNRDINHRSLPVVMGIGKHEDGYKVYLQIPQPDPNASQIRVVSDSGDTINEVIDRISTNMESRIDLLHLKVILIEKSYAQEGINDVVSSFMRGRDVSPQTVVVICNEPLERFFKDLTEYENNDGLLLYNFFGDNAGWNPQIAKTYLWQLFRSIHSYTHDTAIPVISTGDSVPIINMGSAIIKGGKMVDVINEDETLLFNIFLGMSGHGKIEVVDHAEVMIVGSNMRLKARLEGDRPYLDCSLQLKVSIIETKGDITKETIRKDLNDLLIKRLYKLMAKLQKNGADVLGIGQLFRNKLPRDQLADWKADYFARMKVDFKTNVIIQNVGNLKLDE